MKAVEGIYIYIYIKKKKRKEEEEEDINELTYISLSNTEVVKTLRLYTYITKYSCGSKKLM